MRLRSALAALLLCCLFSMPVLAATSIDNVRVYRAPEYTRFVFDVSEPPKYQVLPNVAPGRVVIDFRDAALKARLDAVDLAESPVRRVRSGLQADGTLRVVLDLAVDVRVNSFTLPPNDLYGHRLVVDLYDKTPEAAPEAEAAPAVVATPPSVPTPSVPTPSVPTPSATQPAPVPAFAAPAGTANAGQPPAPSVPAVPGTAASVVPAASTTTATATTPPPAAPAKPPAVAATSAGSKPATLVEPRRVVVAIDAGHGGEDPGARGPKGTREKDVVLAIARAVRERMKDEPGMKAVLIRDGDYYVGLKERRTRARKKYNADLFVSIHADAFTRREARGASVFAVSRRGATSTLAAYLADSENRADLVGGVDPRTENDLVNVLSDMMMEGTMRESLMLGRGVLDELGDFAHLHKRSVEQAGFMVLKEPNMPSILVETGFISNPEEERLLGTAAYQQRLAGAIVKGVRRYFENSPPPGTWFAARRDGQVPVAAVTRESEPADPFMQLAQDGTDAAADDADASAAGPEAGEAPRTRKPEKSASVKKPAAPAYVKHKVGKGQSLGWLAKKYGVTQREIKEANGLRRDDIRIGETLKIPKK
jgi:N-acetylmuramoyl-L-alanine amidase